MNKLKESIKYYYFGLKYFNNCFKVLKRGQSQAYEILQLSHRLEKGLLNKKPKKNWGEKKAIKLFNLIQLCDNRSVVEIGSSVLHAYCNVKQTKGCDSEKEFCKELLLKLEALKFQDYCCGGIESIRKGDMCFDPQFFERFISSRHSVREFSDEKIGIDEISKAVNLALKAPSACNRQPCSVYILPKERICLDDNIDNSYNAAAIAYITTNISAFNIDEYLDWIVNGSIFSTYFVLSLHSLGIGSCIIRKDLLRRKCNASIYKKCKIPANEQIILEIAIGKYKDSFTIAKSTRIEGSNIIHIVE